MIGSRVSHYQIVRELGAGGMGVVYEAEDTQLGRRVALKFLPATLGADAGALERFQREARAASALNHPNICTVFATGQHEGRHFIAMELLEGQTLDRMIGTMPFDVASLVAIGLQIADALDSAHAKCIVHRDVKPANISVNARGHVKLLDFGLATAGAAAPGDMAGDTRTAALTAPGTAMGTMAYMSPEQARGEVTDARSDLFSLGVTLYQMATGSLPFKGETAAVVFDAILNRHPVPVSASNGSLPAALGRVIERALEKERGLRHQTAAELRSELLRVKRDLDAGTSAAEKAAGPSVAVLYFEHLGGAKEDEYFRDGMTEDIITELSKIRGLNTFSRAAMLAFRDSAATPAHVGQQLGAAFVLTGSLRRAGSRLRINAQLVDTRTGFPVWSERYDREVADVFEVQDEIARRIADALRITLSPQERAALAEKPTVSAEAYDLYLKGRSYARRLTQPDMELALQMFEGAVKLDPSFALAIAAIANTCALQHQRHVPDAALMARASEAAGQAMAIEPGLPEGRVARGWVCYVNRDFDRAAAEARAALARKPDCEGAYYLLGNALFSAGRYDEVADIADAAIKASGDDYNIYVPITNALGAMGRMDLRLDVSMRREAVLEAQVRAMPDDVRARLQLAMVYAMSDRPDDAAREAHLAIALRPNDAVVLYNAACTFALMRRKQEALDALRQAWEAGFRDSAWANRDPDLAILRDEPLFQALYPRDV